MKVISKTRKAHNWNEDRFINGKNFNIVLDGATPLIKDKNFNSARWMVEYIKKHINRYGGGIKERFTALCRDAYMDLPVKEKSAAAMPSASACWAEFDGDRLRIGVLGDCEATVIKKDGSIVRCFCGDVARLDAVAIEKLKEICKQKGATDIIGSRRFIDDILIEHRNLINKDGGYSALTLSENPVINEKTFLLDVGEISKVYLYSDGFSQAFEHLQIYENHIEMFSQIDDIKEEIAKIAVTSYSDRLGTKYPRFKIIDDITVTEITL